MCHPAGDLKSLSYSSTLETGDNEKWEEESAPPPFFLPDGKWKMSPRQRRIRKEKGRMRHTHNDIRRREREKKRGKKKRSILLSFSLYVCLMGKRGERERERAEDALFDGIGSSFFSFLYGADDRREQRAEMRKRNEIKIYKKDGEYERNKSEREKKEAIATHHSILNRSHLDGRSHHPPGKQRRGRNWGGR
jgi:hypothetical protein